MKHMRKKRSVLIAVILFTMMITGMTSCGKSSSKNGLMEGASPGTSALALYHSDGTSVSCSYIYDSETIESVLGELDAVEAPFAPDWSLAEITYPIYGFWITATDGSGIFVAWSNGYWISQDGTAYRFHFDFADLVKEYRWSDKQEVLSFSDFPCARFLTQDESGWENMLLTPAAELDPPDGIAMTLEAWEKDTVKVAIANDRDTDWMYGEYYSLQVSLDGVWYEVPPMPGHWGFHDIGLAIQAGEKREQIYHLGMYGELPAGTYRIVADGGLAVENTIP